MSSLVQLGESGFELGEGITVRVVFADVAEDFLALRVDEDQGGVVDHLAVEFVAVGDAQLLGQGSFRIAVNRVFCQCFFRELAAPLEDFGCGIRFDEDLHGVGEVFGDGQILPGMAQADGAFGLQQKVQDDIFSLLSGEIEAGIAGGGFQREVRHGFGGRK